MITRFGMSDRFGLMGLATVESEYLGGGARLTCSDRTAADVDTEVMNLLKQCYDEAKEMLAGNRELMDKLAAHLIEKETISDLDKGFVSRFKSLVEERMKDAELNVEDLGRNMGMSRVQLYRKLKSLTNYSPNELLRQMRLKKAASLLASSDMTVAEIAYEVGFSSPSYFTKCYKEQFGESPTEFLKRRG